MDTLNIGRDGHTDIVIDDESVSPLHATLAKDEDGFIWLEDQDSAQGLHLQRNGQWLRVRKTKLSVGDRIRLGEAEVTLESLSARMGEGVRLHPARFPDQVRKRNQVEPDGELLSKPRRNPVTGVIEESKATAEGKSES